jgi:hypothetical protein
MAVKSDILDRALAPLEQRLSRELAQGLLTLDFSESDHARYQVLARKAQGGSLTPEERSELDWYLDLNDFLSILKLKAELALQRPNPAA